MTTETRTLVAHPNIIVHLIRSQAGTFAKALVESIMNSMDAGATLIEIELDSSRYSVTDNGHGFRTRAEVLKVFEVFGFVHDDRHRDMGMFGLGRAQAFNWATNVWRTGTFRLNVDIRARGLDYELESELEPFPGLRIDGAFYEPMSELDKHNLQLELERLCKYVAVPVLFNGRELQRDPAKMRWTHEDDDAYLKVSERTTLAVYSQGVFVRDYPAHEMGVGGTLVTKHGKPLAVNMSRSDVLTHQCKLWAELRRRIKDIANKGVSGAAKKSRLTDTQRDFLALESADPANVHHLKEKLVELANGRFASPESIGQKLIDGRVILTLAEKGNRIADTAIQERSAVIVSPRTLGRFGVDSVTELASLLAKRMQASEDRDLRHAGCGFKYALEAKRVYDTFSASPVHKRLDASTVPQSKWSPAEKLVIGVVRDYSGRIGYMVRCALVDHDLVPADQRYTGVRRELSVGESDTAEAFTDGKTYVALSRSLIDSVYKGGLRDMQRLLGVLVHEMVHDCDSSDSHAHDHAFYEVFHDVMLSASGELYDMGLAAFRQLCAKREKLTARQARELDRSAA